MLDNKKIVKGVLGADKTGTAMFGDKDKDGVSNVFDCKPNDPNKQGFLHDLTEKAKAKYQEYQEKQKPIREAAEQERQKQAIETARYREQHKGEIQRKFIREAGKRKSVSFGTGTGIFGGGLNTFLLDGTQQRASAGKRGGMRKVVKYVKSGKHYKKKTFYKRTIPRASKPKQTNQPNILGGLRL